MTKQDLIDRTREFAIRIINMTGHLPDNLSSEVIKGQIIRSVTSLGANYRAACRSKSKRDFINKLKIVEEETDETLFWLEMIEEADLIKREKLINLKEENQELLAIFVSSLKTAKESLKATIIKNKKPV